MSWSECLYQYHQKRGGRLLAGGGKDALLVLDWKGQPLAVDLSHYASSGRYGVSSAYFVRARMPATLGRAYKLSIGPENPLSGGVNAVLKAAPGLASRLALPADFGFPEATKKRLITSDDAPFTKLVLEDLGFRNALLACPEDKVEVRPGPGPEGLHMVCVSTDASVESPKGNWMLDTLEDFGEFYRGGEELEQIARRVEDEFFPRMDRFLDLCRAAYGAVTRWPR